MVDVKQTQDSATTGQTGDAVKVETSSSTIETKPEAKSSFLSTEESKGSEQGQTSDKVKPVAAVGEFEVKFPEGVQIDEAMLASYKSTAKEAGATPQVAQAMADWYAKQMPSIEKARMQEMEQVSKKWETELTGDANFGGQHLDSSKADIRRALAATPEGKALAEDLNRFGLGYLPSACRYLQAIGKRMSEDTTRVDTASGSQKPVDAKEAKQKALYNKSQGS
jgi:hypothetical protein